MRGTLTFDRANAGLNLALGQVTVANYALPASLIFKMTDVLEQRFEFSLEGLFDQRASSLA